MNASPFSDWLGTATLVGFLGLLMMALFLGGSTFAWTSWAELSLFAGSVLLLCAFAFAELRAKEPVLPPRLFRIRNVSVATTVNLLRAVAFFAVIVYVPLFAAKGLGAGIGAQRNVLYSFTLPLTAGILVGGTAISRLGFKTPALLGAVIASIGLLLLTTMRSSSSILQLMEFCVPVGFGNGMMIPATIVAFQNSVQKREIGIASGLATFTLNLGGSIGVSVLGAVQIGLLNSELSRWLAAAPGLQSGIIEREAFSASILPIFSISLVVSVATFVAVLLMKRVSPTEPAQGPGRLPGDM
jgi:hypothetical protein